jgi:hypothetical protein
MNHDLWEQIVVRFRDQPDDCRYTPASLREVEAFETEFGVIPAEFRRFLLELGGGTVGAEWVDGIAELSTTHRKFRLEANQPNGWSMKNVFIIGCDGAGNPFGIENATGRIVVEDHNFGGLQEMSPSFELFLIRGLM